ncbi:unnamed protein product [Vitrella brassicaformis CCMP3155]|uniref:Uncharacterized protein n=1 Tax=Vitrella brassicaformis (strain CCMP3155) TaxID=1169540 RepID=A0A0G4EHZ0_VITBC|nr:unnamed protein product [Vitrella brassicaformis CCMP3155]|eukprot:CEL95857.1 unnamed protein product [Vitrella brassicaformis CCMP3155]
MAALVSLGSDKKLKAVYMELTGVGQKGLQWGQSVERLPAVEYMIIKLDVCRARPTVTSLLQLRGLRELHVYVHRNECVQRAMTQHNVHGFTITQRNGSGDVVWFRLEWAVEDGMVEVTAQREAQEVSSCPATRPCL